MVLGGFMDSGTIFVLILAACFIGFIAYLAMSSRHAPSESKQDSDHRHAA
jgi:hypothetical protein